MAHVFLSYSREDADFMRRLRSDLRSRGFDVWTDETGLEPGTPAWESAIQDAIEGAGGVVVVLSPNAKDSLWVTRELSYAEDHGLRIFPVLARGERTESVPLRLTSTQFVDARENYGEALQTLLDALYRHLKIEIPTEPGRRRPPVAAPPQPVAAPHGAAAPTPTPTAKPARRGVPALVWIGVVACAAVIGGLVLLQPRTVPRVLGMPIEHAVRTLDEAGFAARVNHTPTCDADANPDIVMEQYPRFVASALTGDEVEIYSYVFDCPEERPPGEEPAPPPEEPVP